MELTQAGGNGGHDQGEASREKTGNTVVLLSLYIQ